MKQKKVETLLYSAIGVIVMFAIVVGITASDVAHGPIRARILASSQLPKARAAATSGSDVASAKQGAVSRLVQVYANRGHLIANLDPLGLQQPTQRPQLKLWWKKRSLRSRSSSSADIDGGTRPTPFK